MRLSSFIILILCLSILILFSAFTRYDKVIYQQSLSEETQECINCHSTITPGIVSDWFQSRHSKITPNEALKKSIIERRISAENLPDKLSNYIVGCYECHGQNPDKHKDNFEHFGFSINIIVSPKDCKTCHPIEVSQYSEGKKSYAYKNLMENPVYLTLVETITGLKSTSNISITTQKPSPSTLRETCLGCHGTKVEVNGYREISTDLGEIEIPNLTNWPNQGVGRINPDGSFGSCTSCHPRHSFSIEIARKPYTCGQCHLEPDVPAWNVYKESKHGNIYFSKYHEWNFDAVPWIIGENFTSPTCATCHNSLLVSNDGDVVTERTHNFGDRLWLRLFGLIYSHPQPKSGNTTLIKNRDGLPLPTTLDNQIVTEYLIDKNEQMKRQNEMKKICSSCHSSQWIDGHFAKLENTIDEVDKMILSTTKLISEAWKKEIENNANPFDESIEKMWIRQWLFYGNSIKYSSAMTGAPDYATFKNGWWEMSENLQKIRDLIEIKEKTTRKKK